jgi:DNA-binding response OmpR family regulator
MAGRTAVVELPDAGLAACARWRAAVGAVGAPGRRVAPAQDRAARSARAHREAARDGIGAPGRARACRGARGGECCTGTRRSAREDLQRAADIDADPDHDPERAGCQPPGFAVRIVLVEDNLQLATTISDGLSEDGYRVDVIATAAGAIERGLRRDLDVMVLDLGLPDRDGLEVLRELRGVRINVPILVLTARDAVEARVAALDAGADDYLVKPFAFAELVARIAALARRAAGPRWAPASDVSLTMRDDLVIESGGRTVALSPREYALFGCLLRRRGEVVARAEILRDAFGYEFDPGTNVIDVHLNHLRKKLQGFPVAIETVRGAGIRLVVSE